LVKLKYADINISIYEQQIELLVIINLFYSDLSEEYNYQQPAPRGSNSRLCRVRKVVYCNKDIQGPFSQNRERFFFITELL